MIRVCVVLLAVAGTAAAAGSLGRSLSADTASMKRVLDLLQQRSHQAVRHGRHLSRSTECQAAVDAASAFYAANPSMQTACETLVGSKSYATTGCTGTVTDSYLYFESDSAANSNCNGACLPDFRVMMQNLTTAGCTTASLAPLCTTDADCTGTNETCVASAGECRTTCSSDNDCDCTESCDTYCKPRGSPKALNPSSPGQTVAAIDFACSRHPDTTNWCLPLVANTVVNTSTPNGPECNTILINDCCFGNLIEYVGVCAQTSRFPLGDSSGVSEDTFRDDIKTACPGTNPSRPRPVQIAGACADFATVPKEFCGAMSVTSSSLLLALSALMLAFLARN